VADVELEIEELEDVEKRRDEVRPQTKEDR
jgi:hypothetical protein